jgi:hypothetical protein
MRGQPDCDQTADKQQVQDKDDTQSACKSRAAAYRLLGQRFNALQDTRLDISLRPFHHRPAWVLGADRFDAASLECVDNPVLARLPLVGALDQLLDCTDVLSHPALTSPMRCYYDAMAAENPRQTRNGGQLRGTNAHA